MFIKTSESNYNPTCDSTETIEELLSYDYPGQVFVTLIVDKHNLVQKIEFNKDCSWSVVVKDNRPLEIVIKILVEYLKPNKDQITIIYLINL